MSHADPHPHPQDHDSAIVIRDTFVWDSGMAALPTPLQAEEAIRERILRAFSGLPFESRVAGFKWLVEPDSDGYGSPYTIDDRGRIVAPYEAVVVPAIPSDIHSIYPLPENPENPKNPKDPKDPKDPGPQK